jgi:hypothetical protein
MKLFQFVTVAAAAAAILVFCVPAGAGMLPPIGTYKTAQDVHTCFAAGGGMDCIEQGNHGDFINVVATFNSSGETEHFGSHFSGEVYGGPGCPGLIACTLIGTLNMNGPVTVFISGRTNDTMTGTFNTEMLQLDLSGGGLMVRESPTLHSLGQTTITSLGGGDFRINSFFDIFTELSLDGGTSWIPQQGPASHVALTPSVVEHIVPEPGSLLLGGAGLLCLGLARRKRANRR